MDMKASPSLKCSKFPKCEKNIQHKIEVQISDAQMEKFRQDYRVTPLFEQKIKNYKDGAHTSLVRNKLLACRWQERVCNAETYKNKIFTFPRVRDFHFRNYQSRYLPELSPDNRSNNRLTMRIGPRVDRYGQIPIPDDHRDLPVDRKHGSRKFKERDGKKENCGKAENNGKKKYCIEPEKKRED